MNRRIGCLILAAAGACAVALPLGDSVLEAQQQPQPQAPAQPQAQTAAPAPTTRASTTQPANGNGGANGATSRPTTANTRISMNFQDASIEAGLKHPSEAAGLLVVKEPKDPRQNPI